jgi:hypothetical protein
MTDEERKREGDEEPVEDLEAPAEAQDDVAGGLLADGDDAKCKKPTKRWCQPGTKVDCISPTCVGTGVAAQ